MVILSVDRKIILNQAIAILIAQFKANSTAAGLCLRCYVSYPILKAFDDSPQITF